jgi:pyridoxamine 5'-phosphate oxidase
MRELDEQSVDADPFQQLRAWLDDATTAGYVEPNAMTVATVDALGRPSARIVLLRRVDPRGLVFFTNYLSRKGREIAEHAQVAAVFYWDSLARQVRVEGSASRIDATESDEYFHSRPRGHQLGAWASPQSTVVPDRAFLEERFAALEREYKGREIDRPPYWGGLRIAPERFEFWQGRPNRIHDRIVYVQNGAVWKVERLAP